MGKTYQAEHQGAARLCGPRAPSRASSDGVPVHDLPDRDQRRRQGGERSCSAATNWSPTRAGGWSAKDTGEREELPVQLVVRSVGYRGVPTPGAAVRRQERDHSQHRRPGARARRNEYVVGWIKRGPTGVIGTNKKDSQDTVDTLMADLAGARRSWRRFPRRPCRQAGRLAGLTPAEAGHLRALGAHRPPRASGRRAARASARQAAEPGQAAAHQPRLITGRAAPRD